MNLRLGNQSPLRFDWSQIAAAHNTVCGEALGWQPSNYPMIPLGQKNGRDGMIKPHDSLPE